MGQIFRVHDLLWLANADDLLVDTPPAWATHEWRSVAPVVVRRAEATAPGLLPVGLRGATRSERWAAQIPAAGVVRWRTAEEIACRWLRRASWLRSLLPCLQALDAVGPALNDQPLAWGVTGGVGFTLASGLDVLRPESDLDLIIRTSDAGDAAALREVAEVLARCPSRVDAQIETPLGAFALSEWTRTGGPVLLKTTRGPLLTDDPWCVAGRPLPA